MVKVEDRNTDDSSDDVVLHKNVVSSSSKPSSGSVLLREVKAEGHDGDGPSDIFSYRNVGSSSSIPTSIPAPVKEIIYGNGATKFWIYDMGPIGCLPQTLALRKKNDSVLDEFGCMAVTTMLLKLSMRGFNAGLSDLCDELRSQYKNATVVCTDKYGIRYDLVANHTNYGFENLLMACCGHGGPPGQDGLRTAHRITLSVGLTICKLGWSSQTLKLPMR